MKALATNLQISDNSSESQVVYLYFMEHVDSGTKLYLTNYDGPISLSNCPDWIGGGVQEFGPTAIKHDSIKFTSDNNSSGVQIQMAIDSGFLRQYFITAPTSRIESAIFRVNPGDGTVDFTTDAAVVSRGRLFNISFTGPIITASIVPIFNQGDRVLPRYYYQRQCNHMFCGPSCGLTLAAFAHSTVIISANRWNKTVTVAVTPVGTAFRGGFLRCVDTGLKDGIIDSATVSAGVVILRLSYWLEAFENEGYEVTVYDDCSAKANLANFGGMPYIPTENISYDGTA